MLLGLSPAQERAYRETLHGVYERRVYVNLLDRAGDTVASFTRAFQGGQIGLDTRRPVDRVANIAILDPKHRFGFDADTYSGGNLDLSRQIRVWWAVDGPLLAEEVKVGTFMGPITRLGRDGALLSIEAQGREVYGLTKNRATLTVKKGAKRTDALKQVLYKLMGETRLGMIPDLDARLPDDFVVTPKDLPWRKALKLADSVNRQLYYNGDGVPVARRRATNVAWKFEDAPGGGITSPVRVESDLTRVRNRIRVTGHTPKGAKAVPVTGSATADRSHPLSPWNLGLPNAPMWLDEEFTNETLRTKKECDQYAEEKLQELLRLHAEVSFNSVPVPCRDPGDLIRVTSNYEDVRTRVETFDLPLDVDGDQQWGYSDPFRLRRKKVA